MESVDLVTKSENNVYLNTGELGERFLGNQQMSPFVLLGVAYQAGLLPVRAVSLEEALQQVGEETQASTAFRLGRFYQLNLKELAPAMDTEQWDRRDPTDLAVTKLQGKGASAVKECEQILAEHAVDDGALKLVFYPRVADLMLYQNGRYARQYATFVIKTMRSEQQQVPGRLGLTIAVARYLFKLMAYKDEYEVARLHLLDANRQRLASLFGDLALCKVSYRLRLPWEKDITIVAGWWVEPALRFLASSKWLRRYSWNPFGSSSVRRLERNLISWYQQVIEDLLGGLHQGNYLVATSIAMAPEKIRGYGHIKEASIVEVKAAVEKCLLLYKTGTKEAAMMPDPIADIGQGGSSASSSAGRKTIPMYQG
jgi:indolepyruvate ferredoxin oxidoreductase